MLSNVFRFLRLSIPNLYKLAITVCTISILIGCSGNKKRILDNFEIHEDYRIELVASEPMVFDPVDLEFDENGYAYVLEMPGYPMREEVSCLIKLVDLDLSVVFDIRHLGTLDTNFTNMLSKFANPSIRRLKIDIAIEFFPSFLTDS